MNIYHQKLMDHYHHPRHKGVVATPSFSSHKHNPSCGDAIVWQGIVDDAGLLTAVAFQGSGCVISQATASLLADLVQHWSVNQIKTLSSPDVIKLIGIDLGPTRLMCALLPLHALQEGLCSIVVDS